MRARTVLFSVSYVALVAAAIAHLSSPHRHGLFGYALAEQSPNAKRSAAAVPMPSSSPSEEQKQDSNCTCFASFVAAVVSLFCSGCAAFVLCYTRDTYWLIMEMSFLVDLSIFCWMCTLTLQILHGVFIEVDHMTTTCLIGPASLCLLEISVSYFFGKAMGTLVYSLGMIGMAGLFGYSLGIYAHYNNHLVIGGFYGSQQTAPSSRFY